MPESARDHHALAVVEVRVQERRTFGAVALCGPRRVADQHVDLTGLQCGEAVVGFYVDRHRRGRVTEDRRRDRAAEVDVEPDVLTAGIQRCEARQVVAAPATNFTGCLHRGQRLAGLGTAAAASASSGASVSSVASSVVSVAASSSSSSSPVQAPNASTSATAQIAEAVRDRRTGTPRSSPREARLVLPGTETVRNRPSARAETGPLLLRVGRGGRGSPVRAQRRRRHRVQGRGHRAPRPRARAGADRRHRGRVGVRTDPALVGPREPVRAGSSGSTSVVPVFRSVSRPMPRLRSRIGSTT